jgi:large subunit ribosomal protein L22
MTQAKAVSKFVRISPRKARYAADLVRNLPVTHATAQLKFSDLKGSKLLLKVLDSAVANAKEQHDVAAEQLTVVEVRVDEGPRMKRVRSRNRGGRHMILKRMSHLTVVVAKQ